MADDERRGKLPGYQRKFLRGLAHELAPVVRVGKAGVSDAVVEAVNAALLTHELIKVRLYDPEDKKQMADLIAERCDAHLCGLVGHTLILYREHPEEPRIILPRRPESDDQTGGSTG